jgi:hypothetical protein
MRSEGCKERKRDGGQSQGGRVSSYTQARRHAGKQPGRHAGKQPGRHAGTQDKGAKQTRTVLPHAQ